MTAPALVLLSQGSSDPQVAHILHGVRKQLQMARPELSVHIAFLDHCPPTGSTVVSTLVQRGVREMVFIPLDMTRAVDPEPAAVAMLSRVRASFPDVAVTLARPIGPATELLNVLDTMVREGLRSAHAVELDGLVLSTPGTGDVRGNALIARRARQWSTHHRLPVVVSVGDGSGPNSAQAIAALRSQGRRHIGVGSFFVAGDENFHAQAELARQAGAIAVSAPMGAHPLVLDLVLARYAFAAMELLDSQVAQDSFNREHPFSLAN
ncbi:sirohydrochlorin chelatase [Luteococcus sanguinis]|uniref:Sirohydrochlorin chelatase n=1 Tax=Luteococcus sanguinis TaxID=174038 RepID=A0ABW1X153_9ACTN